MVRVLYHMGHLMGQVQIYWICPIFFLFFFDLIETLWEESNING